MTLYPGDPFTLTEFTAQTGAIVERYQREGYVDPKVSINAHRDAADSNAVIVVDIDKGPHYELGRLTIEGNQGVSSNALKRRMTVWRAALLPGIGRFSEYRLKKDMDSLLKYFRRKGFADAQRSYRIDDPGDSHQANVAVQVQEGQHYTIAFDGNKRFWNRTLKKDVVIFNDGAFVPETLKTDNYAVTPFT